jgi:hypothetical protein
MKINVKIRMCESALERISAEPDILGYFPDSRLKLGDDIPPSSILAERKHIENLLTSAAYRGELDSINVLSEGVPLAIFERYDNFRDERIVAADIRDILFANAEFPNSLLPLAGICIAYLHQRIDHKDLDAYMNAFKKMGLSQMAEDPRYLATMLRKLFSLRVTAGQWDDEFSSLMGKLADHGVFIHPSLISTDIDLDQLGCRVSAPGESSRKKDPEYDNKHAYVAALIDHRARGGSLPFPDCDFSHNSIINNFVRAYVFESTRLESLAENYMETYDFRNIFETLDNNLSDIKKFRQYITSTKPSELNHFSLLSMVMKSGYGRSLKSRKTIINSMLKNGLSEKISSGDGLIRFLRHFNNNYVDSDIYQMVLPLVNFDLIDKAIRPVEIVRMALENNQFANNRLCKIENSYDKGRFVALAFSKMTEGEQRKAVEMALPGFTHELLRESRHNGIKRELLADDLGM